MARMRTLRKLRSDYMITSLGTDVADSVVFFILFFQFKSDTAPNGRVAIRSRIHECESLFITEMHLAALA